MELMEVSVGWRGSVAVIVLQLCRLLWVFGVGRVWTAAQDCVTANALCHKQVGCGMAMHNYEVNCGRLLHGEVTTCSPSCKKAIISLLTSHEQYGQQLMACDCLENPYCLQKKQRLEACEPDVITSMALSTDPRPSISCPLAELICTSDTSCYNALKYYQHYCSSMVLGEHCTSDCNTSLAYLYSQPKAVKLRTCQCEGSEGYNCRAAKWNTRVLCGVNVEDWWLFDNFNYSVHPAALSHTTHTHCHGLMLIILLLSLMPLH